MPPVKTSAVWKLFNKADKNGAYCLNCSKFIKSSGNTSNFRKHLLVHNIGISVTTPVNSPAKKRKRSSEDEEFPITKTPKRSEQVNLDYTFHRQLSFKGKQIVSDCNKRPVRETVFQIGTNLYKQTKSTKVY